MGKADNYYRRVKADREAWRAEMPQACMYCGRDFMLQVHEIERRGQAGTRWGQRCNYLLLCEICHAGPFATMPHEAQLAVKLVADGKHFNLTEWLRIKDPELRAPERITFEDIAIYLAVTK